MSSKKENAMTLKSQLADHVAGVVSQIEQRAEELPAQVDDVKETLSEWGNRGRSFVRKNPGIAVVGAFAVGFFLAKLARHA
jgi:hypothetical protein